MAEAGSREFLGLELIEAGNKGSEPNKLRLGRGLGGKINGDFEY
jgi:hypothetical protein